MAKKDKQVEREVVEVRPPESRINQVIYFLVGLVEIILLFRFVLRLFGASTESNFVQFIYDISQPLVTPFFGIFNSDITYGAGAFELETLIAMIVYMLVGYIIVALVNIVRGRKIEE